MKRRYHIGVVVAAICLLLFDCLKLGAEIPPSRIQRLDASVIKSRMRSSQKLRYGLPLREADRTSCRNVLSDIAHTERISCGGPYWISENLDLKFPCWVGWNVASHSIASTDFAPSAPGPELWQDYMTALMPKGSFNVNPELWKAVMSESVKWADETPAGGTAVVCGPVLGKMSDEIPKAFFVALCKRTNKALGYKSIAFLLPCFSAPSAIYKYSLSVNILERLTGYDFFPSLPSQVQELVENMTTYELFCSYQEERDYQEGPELPDNDFQELLYDMLEDMR